MVQRPISDQRSVKNCQRNRFLYKSSIVPSLFPTTSVAQSRQRVDSKYDDTFCPPLMRFPERSGLDGLRGHTGLSHRLTIMLYHPGIEGMEITFFHIRLAKPACKVDAARPVTKGLKGIMEVARKGSTGRLMRIVHSSSGVRQPR